MDIEKYISYQIESQFPSLYKEQGEELISFVKSYYEFLENDIGGVYLTGYKITGETETSLSYFSERYDTYSKAEARYNILKAEPGIYGDLKITNLNNQSIYHNRRLFEYNDIDDTLGKMLIFYKKKYLSGLPFKDDDIRFITKHIMDLYRRKGSSEGIELFFRLFYNENITVYYPANDMLKPSASVWKVGEYLELLPTDPNKLANLKRLPIYGSISRATAIVDRVNFIMIKNTLVPVIYLSSVKGNFVRFDDIVYNNEVYGIVRGSLDSIVIPVSELNRRSSNNVVGDILDVVSATGYGGQARVSKINEEVSGEIEYKVNNGGFGYTLPDTDIIVSNQTLFFNSEKLPLKPLEVVTQTSSGARGFVVGQNSISVGIFRTSSNSFVTSNTSSSTFIRTVDRISNSNTSILFSSEYNDTSSARIGSISNIENISIFVDLIEDFLNVRLDSSNYSSVPPAVRQMSGNAPFGTPPITLNTVISDAFRYVDFEIGTIETLTDIDPGFEYLNDVFVLAKDNVISRFRKTNQLLAFDPLSGVNISVGDILTQNDPTKVSPNSAIKGIVKGRNGNILDVAQLTFRGFSTANTIFIQGSNNPISLISVEKNSDSLPIGLNADIAGITFSGVGKISEVEVFDSGVGFLDDDQVFLKNITRNTGNVSSIGIASAKLQGKTAGMWESKTSHLNSKKVIQDSNFYQDFSYEIASKLDPEFYIDPLKDLMHVSGTKVFHRIKLEEDINMNIDITSLPVRNSFSDASLISSDNQNMTTGDGVVLLGSQFTITEE